MTYFAAGAGVVALLFAGVLLAGQLADILGRSAGGESATPERDSTPPSGQSPGASPEGQIGTCTRQSVSAPSTGTWRMATQRGDIRLTSEGRATRLLFRVYQAGAGQEAAQVTAEMLPLEEVEPRFGMAPPAGGDAALVLSFSEQFGASGQRFELGSVGAVSGVHVAKVDSRVFAVAGVRGGGCFALSAPGWQGDDGERSAEIVIDITR